MLSPATPLSLAAASARVGAGNVLPEPGAAPWNAKLAAPFASRVSALPPIVAPSIVAPVT